MPVNTNMMRGADGVSFDLPIDSIYDGTTTVTTGTDTNGATITTTATPDEQALNRQLVINFYRQYLQREPDAAGLDFWANEVNTGRKTFEDLRQAFVVSGEYLALHPELPDPSTGGPSGGDPSNIFGALKDIPLPVWIGLGLLFFLSD